MRQNGIPLYKRPPPPVEEEEIDDEERARREKEEELRKAKEAKQKKKKKDDDHPDEPPPPEDLALSEQVPKPDEQTGYIKELRGYIFIDFPCSEEQINALKECKIPMDRIIVLRENEEEEAGPTAPITERPGFFDTTLLENEKAHMERQEILKENYDEEVLINITMTSEEETFIALRQAVDPFYIRVDEDATARPFDPDNEDSEWLYFGEYAQYDPVAFKDHGWLLIGSEENQLQVRGKRYRFFSPENMALFKTNCPYYLDTPLTDERLISDYVSAGINNTDKCSNPNSLQKRIKMPEPRFFFMGNTGCGMKTQMHMLKTEDYQIIICFCKEHYFFFNFGSKIYSSKPMQR